MFSSLQTDSPENSSENNNNGGAEATVPVMYTKVNKDICKLIDMPHWSIQHKYSIAESFVVSSTLAH